VSELSASGAGESGSSGEEPKQRFNILDLDVLARAMTALKPNQVLDLGPLPEGITNSWDALVSDRVVVTGERYAHIIDRHPEVAGQERRILEAALNPDEIHMNVDDPRIAILYKGGVGLSLMRLALWLSDDSTLQNSIHSVRYAHRGERRRSDRAERRIWPRE
jgi:hypothetical protein